MDITPTAYINAITSDGDTRVKAIANSPGKKKITFIKKDGKVWNKTFKLN